MKPAPRRGPAADRLELEDLGQLRVLAHPLRLRLLQAFAEGPATTKQVADRLSMPATRLYHHVYVLERAGLLRLKETRPNRGTTERYYEAVARRFEFGRQALSRAMRVRDRAPAGGGGRSAAARAREELATERRQARALAEALRAAMIVLDLGRADVRALRRNLSRNTPGLEPVVARALIVGTAEQIQAVRTDLMRLLEKHRNARSRRRTIPSDVRYALTMAFVPEGGAKLRGR